MKMTKLTTLFLTATLTTASGSVLAADAGSSGSNGDANAAAEAGRCAGCKTEYRTNNVDNSNINTGNTNTGGTNTGTMNHEGMTTDEVHKTQFVKTGNARPE